MGTSSQDCPIVRAVRSPLCDADFTWEFLWEHVDQQEEPELPEAPVPLGRSNSGSPAAPPLEGLPWPQLPGGRGHGRGLPGVMVP